MANKLQQLAAAAIAAKRLTETDKTFNIDACETKVSKLNNVGFRAVLADGSTVTFWSSNMDRVVEAIDDNGNFRIITGTTITDDGSLIPKDSASSGFWS